MSGASGRERAGDECGANAATAAGPLDLSARATPLTVPGEVAVSIDAAHTTGPRVFAAYELEVAAGDPRPVFLAQSDDRWTTYHDRAVNDAANVCTEGCSPEPRLVSFGSQAALVWTTDGALRLRPGSALVRAR